MSHPRPLTAQERDIIMSSVGYISTGSPQYALIAALLHAEAERDAARKEVEELEHQVMVLSASIPNNTDEIVGLRE